MVEVPLSATQGRASGMQFCSELECPKYERMLRSFQSHPTRTLTYRTADTSGVVAHLSPQFYEFLGTAYDFIFFH